eukprot:12253559-Alexandrium_andersonii.AAC.1
MARGVAYANVALQEMAAVPNGAAYALVLFVAVMRFFAAADCFCAGRWSAKFHSRRVGAEWR